MKRQWTIKRHLKETLDGQTRWDRAYQILLKADPLSQRGTAGTVPALPQPMAHQETPDENSPLRPCLNAPASSKADD